MYVRLYMVYIYNIPLLQQYNQILQTGPLMVSGPPTCLRAEIQACPSLLAICDTMKLMAAEVVAIRLGEKVSEGGGFANNLQTLERGDSHSVIIETSDKSDRRERHTEDTCSTGEY